LKLEKWKGAGMQPAVNFSTLEPEDKK